MGRLESLQRQRQRKCMLYNANTVSNLRPTYGIFGGVLNISYKRNVTCIVLITPEDGGFLYNNVHVIIVSLVIWDLNSFIPKDITNVRQQHASIPVVSHMTSIVHSSNLETACHIYSTHVRVVYIHTFSNPNTLGPRIVRINENFGLVITELVRTTTKLIIIIEDLRFYPNTEINPN